MSDIPQIREYRRQASQRRPDGGPTYRQLPPHRPKPEPRTPDQIKDATIVLGVPKEEFTPKVHEAMTLVFHEMDSVRWELEVCATQRERLEDDMDRHLLTGLANRRALYRHLSRAAEHVKSTGEPGFLLLLKLQGLEALWREEGFEAEEEILQKVAVVLEAEVPPSSPFGYLDGGSFGIVLNVSTPDEVERLGGRLLDCLAIPTIRCLWACAPIEADTPAAAIHAAAEQDARRKV